MGKIAALAILLFVTRSAAASVFTIVSEVPVAGSNVTAAPTQFKITVDSPVDPVSVDGGDLEVNGLPADTGLLSGSGLELTFIFNTTPVVSQGLQTMAVAAGAFDRVLDGAPVEAFSSNFTFGPAPVVVPEPGTLALLLVGVAGAASALRRRI